VSFNSLEFVAFCLFSVVLLRTVPPGLWRNLAVFGINAAFVATFAASFVQVVPLVCFVLVGYLAILAVARHAALWPAIVIVLGLFIWLKHYAIVAALPTLSFLYLSVGLSYILFRILHLVIDVAQGSQKAPGFLAYLNYVFFFLNFVSGPIQRYEDFSAQVSTRPVPISAGAAHDIFDRIIRGYFLVVVISSGASIFQHMVEPQFYEALAGGFSVKAMFYYIAVALAYVTYLYTNFVGYMDIVIGIGRLAGFDLPENFDRPFIAKNFLDFWARWHMTLSGWFKLYLFNPTVKLLMAHWGGSSIRLYLGAIAFFITFFVMGMWHGTTFVYAIYGLMLGFGIAANYAWQTFLTQRMGKKRYRALCDRLWYYQVSRALTLSYFVVAVTCIWIAPEQTAAIGTPAGLAICAAAMIVLAVAGTVGGIVFDTIKARILGQGQRPRLARILAIFTLCLLCILILDAGLRSAIAAQINSVPHLYAATGRFIFFFLAGAIGYGALDPLAERLRQPLHNPGFNPIIGGSWIGVRLLILVNFAILMANDVPEFVYKVF